MALKIRLSSWASIIFCKQVKMILTFCEIVIVHYSLFSDCLLKNLEKVAFVLIFLVSGGTWGIFKH